ncbi:MAG: P-II family nitrogen regulator [Planctomycetota bacterium]|nr:P-II family nitrogen regulator [Planctomycetota bacterium]
MRRLTIVVKPFKVDAVVRALQAAGATCITLTEARGYGRQKGHLERYRDTGRRVTFLPKVRIECAVATERVAAAVDGVIGAARTGRIGDGKIFVEELHN